MAASSGRELVIAIDGTPVSGARTKGMTANGEPVDVTTDDDSGYRKLLAQAGQYSLDLSIEGISVDTTLDELILQGVDLEIENVTITFPDGSEVDGTFFFNSLEKTGTYNESITYTAEMQSSGEWTYTAAAS